MHIIWASTRENLSSGFLTESDSNQPVQLQRLAKIMKFALKEIDYYTVQKTNNKGADQTSQMRRLVCVFVIHMQQSQVS